MRVMKSETVVNVINEAFQFSALNMVTHMYVDTQIFSFSINNDTHVIRYTQID